MPDARNLLHEITTAISASSIATDTEIKTLYLGLARSIHARALVELRELGAGIEAREREAARVAMIDREQGHAVGDAMKRSFVSAPADVKQAGGRRPKK